MSSGTIKIYPTSTFTALIGSDAHYWPGKPSTGHRAFVKFTKTLKPQVVILNGDAIDAASISRHPPIGWEYFPTVKQELEVTYERLREVELASTGSRFIWNLGNHDARFETRLASVVPEFKGVAGTHLRDHFTAWEPAWAVEIGGKNGATIKHRFSGGVNAAYTNALKSGRTTVTGHLHRLVVRPVSDYSGTRWGVEGGMLADRDGPQFRGYTENNPLDWQPGFIVLTWKQGKLMWPEVVHVVKEGQVEYRGELISV